MLASRFSLSKRDEAAARRHSVQSERYDSASSFSSPDEDEDEQSVEQLHSLDVSVRSSSDCSCNN